MRAGSNMASKRELQSLLGGDEDVNNFSINTGGHPPVVTAQPLNNSTFNASGASALEDSPAYHVLQSLLTTEYRLRSATDLNLGKANSTPLCNCVTNLCILPRLCIKTFSVPNGNVRPAEDGKGNYLFFGPGVHWIFNPFMTVAWSNKSIASEIITHGDKTIVTILQGHVGYCEDRGQPVLLPPGLHEWRSPTLRFIRSVDLNNTLVRLGPYTVLTVDEGYSAITQNNGRQVILEGGQTHLLTHRNWKFEKFMTEKIQTDDLQRIEATSADNVKMHTQATVVWRITNVCEAARMSAETMRRDGGDISDASQSDVNKLRKDVLKQATACLAAFIGEVRYSDSFHISAVRDDSSSAPPVPGDCADYSPIWDQTRMASAVTKANNITQTYGVSVLSINIISAVPADAALQNALAKGAVASAEAEQAETIARGEAKAARIMAEGEARAEVIRAEGSHKAAETLSSSAVAVELARLDKVGHVLGDKTSFFFGSDPTTLSTMLSNPAIIGK